jgi:hypothetical protein
LQQQTESKKPPVVPPRNDMAPAPVDMGAHGDEFENKDPDFTYQLVSTNPKHPQYIGRYLVPKRYPTIGPDGKPGEPAIMRPWTVCTTDHDPVLEQGLRRADQGEPIDNKIRNGSQVLIKTPNANAAIAQKTHDDEVKAEARAMRLPQKTQLAGGITVTTAMAGPYAEEDELRDLVQSKKGTR